MVCANNSVTKNDVLFAVTEGSFDLESVMKSVHICDGSCAIGNPSGKSCHDNVQAILDVYVPIFQMMLEGKHDHAHDSNCSGSCSSCSCNCDSREKK